LTAILTAALASAAAPALAAPVCYTSYGGTKPNKLYLYFPTASDPSYPEFGTPLGLPPTSPGHPFNIADLSSYTGTAAALEDRIYDVVADDYCEFNVEVIKTTTAPPTTFPRRNTVLIGTADDTPDQLYGVAQNVDTGDSIAVDFANVWSATYQGMFGGPGGALNGANSTLDRWAQAIGGTAAHEGGHNYGLSHGDGLPLASGEDPLVHHIMASGDHYSGEDRAGYRRHFSDHEYSVLAANVGLSVQTVWNWDFINPNAQTATKLVIDVLSTQPNLTVSGPYNGNESPWVNPTTSASLGSQMFKGVNYNHFQVTWSAGHAWDGHVPGGAGPSPGVPGQVAGGASFHVGTGFLGVNYNTADPVILTNVTLFDASNNALALHPRNVPFNSGTVDAGTGSFDLAAFNIGAPMRIDLVDVQLMPRLLSIGSMIASRPRFQDVRGLPFRPWGKGRTIKIGRTLEQGGSLNIPIAKMSDKRHVVERVEKDCNRGDRGSRGPDTLACRPGINVDMFPATTAFVSVTITDPNAKYWDARQQRYVTGPLTTHEFLQVSGRHPDLNKNKVDDYIDILTGRSKDENRDGVPDEVQKKAKLR
jgi:hypothetical protein